MTLVVMTVVGMNAKQKTMAGVSLRAAYGRDASHVVCVSCQHHCHHVMKQGAGMKYPSMQPAEKISLTCMIYTSTG